MKIFARTLFHGDIILEEIDASSIQGFEHCAIAHVGKRWIVYDIPTGLLIVYGNTRKEAMEQLHQKKLQVYEARRSQLYQKRIKEFEEMKKI